MIVSWIIVVDEGLKPVAGAKLLSSSTRTDVAARFGRRRRYRPQPL